MSTNTIEITCIKHQCLGAEYIIRKTTEETNKFVEYNATVEAEYNIALNSEDDRSLLYDDIDDSDACLVCFEPDDSMEYSNLEMFINDFTKEYSDFEFHNLSIVSLVQPAGVIPYVYGFIEAVRKEHTYNVEYDLVMHVCSTYEYDSYKNLAYELEDVENYRKEAMFDIYGMLDMQILPISPKDCVSPYDRQYYLPCTISKTPTYLPGDIEDYEQCLVHFYSNEFNISFEEIKNELYMFMAEHDEFIFKNILTITEQYGGIHRKSIIVEAVKKYYLYKDNSVVKL
jgi:hypothetical protein